MTGPTTSPPRVWQNQSWLSKSRAASRADSAARVGPCRPAGREDGRGASMPPGVALRDSAVMSPRTRLIGATPPNASLVTVVLGPTRPALHICLSWAKLTTGDLRRRSEARGIRSRMRSKSDRLQERGWRSRAGARTMGWISRATPTMTTPARPGSARKHVPMQQGGRRRRHQTNASPQQLGGESPERSHRNMRTSFACAWPLRGATNMGVHASHFRIAATISGLRPTQLLTQVPPALSQRVKGDIG